MPRVVGLRTGPDRAAARRAIRAAVCSALASALGLPGDAVAIDAAPGRAPFAIAGVPGRRLRVALSISHDGGLSLAALRLGGAVGIDLVRVTDLPDCCEVARDYLGPGAASALAGLPAHARADAFAQAWSAHEARLKCLGLALTEWDAALGRSLSTCALRALALPAGFAGHVALAPA